jgi:hypothetical protein
VSLDGKPDVGRPGRPDSPDIVFENLVRLVASEAERPEEGLGPEAPFELADNVTGICGICHRISFTYTGTIAMAESTPRTMPGFSSAVTGS